MFDCKLSVSYGKRQIIDAEFSLSEGVTVLFGKNGSGKTTLLHSLVGVVLSDGTILLDGVDLNSLPRTQRSKLVSLLPQFLPSPDLPVKEVVAMGRFPHGTKTKKDKALVLSALEKLSLTTLSDRLVSTLSGGERQRVFLAMLLVQDTPIVLLDEPTTYMDVSFRETFFSLLDEWKAQKKTVLLVSHDLFLSNYADRILLLEDKTISFDGTKETCFSQGILEQAFSTRRYETDGLHFFK